jgi:hypothetical protein
MQRENPVHATAARAAVSVNPAVRRRRVAAVRKAMRRWKLDPLRRTKPKE